MNSFTDPDDDDDDWPYERPNKRPGFLGLLVVVIVVLLVAYGAFQQGRF